MNACNFIGRVGRDAVTRFTGAGKPVASWSLAVDTGFGDKKTTTWLDCSLWGERAEKLAQYIHKGDRLGVVGEIGTREHEGKTYVTLNVRDVTLLADKRDDAPQPARKTATKPEPAGGFEDDDPDRIPF